MMWIATRGNVQPGGDIVLQPGDWHVGEGNARIRTVLGTCVSIVLWHPDRRIGGMCHYMVPGRSPRTNGLDGRYAEDAMQLLEEEVRVRGTRLAEYRIIVAGGGNMFPDTITVLREHIGTKNARAARDFVRSLGLRCNCEHLEGVGHREVVLDLQTGRIQVSPSPTASMKGVLPCTG
jgi:chemotaxis protein CheD